MNPRLIPAGMTTIEGCTIERVGHDVVYNAQISKMGQEWNSIVQHVQALAGARQLVITRCDRLPSPRIP